MLRFLLLLRGKDLSLPFPSSPSHPLFFSFPPFSIPPALLFPISDPLLSLGDPPDPAIRGQQLHQPVHQADPGRQTLFGAFLESINVLPLMTWFVF